jgi:trk system potassium uptake protein TrkH
VLQLLAVLNMLSVVILVFALALAAPLLASVALADGATGVFEQAMLVPAAAGMLIRLATRGRRRELLVRDGFLLVALVWTVLPAFGTLPLMLYLPALSFTDAYFEAVSGLTASGATVLSGLDGLPSSINLWRGLMIWLGGMGVIVLAVAILPLLGVGGSQLFKAETPGPMKDTKLTPRIAETAKGLWLVYVGLTALYARLSMGRHELAGRDDAASPPWGWAVSRRTMPVRASGTRQDQLVAMTFMLIAAISFATHFRLAQASLAACRRDSTGRSNVDRARCSASRCSCMPKACTDFWSALRYAAFNVISVATTTATPTPTTTCG